jgi:hypothetical protein
MLLDPLTSGRAKGQINQLHTRTFGHTEKSYRAKILDLKTEEMMGNYNNYEP